jgi:hypothetical protein
MWRVHCSDKHGTSYTLLFRNDVQAPVHAIDEIYVDIACWTEHYLAAFCFAPESMAGWIVMRIGFYL